MEIRLENLPYGTYLAGRQQGTVDIEKLTGTSDMKKVKRYERKPLLLFVNAWSVGMDAGQERRPGACGIQQKLRKRVRQGSFLNCLFSKEEKYSIIKKRQKVSSNREGSAQQRG